MSHSATDHMHALPLRSLTARPNYHWFVVATVCIGAFMAALDASIVTVAQPAIQAKFHTTVSAVEWVALAYLLTLTALLAMFGRISDIVGRRPLYTIGFSVFIVGSALCGASQSLPFLIVMRILQSIGAVMLQANSVAIITAAVPESVRGKAIGIQGSALAVGLSLGPTIGGLLIAGFGWRAIFYVNVPVGIIGTALAALILPRDKPRESSHKERFDYLGALTLAIALVGMMLGLNQGNSRGWASPFILASFAAGIVFTFLFIAIEKRHPSPLVDLSLFKIEQWTWGNISGSLSYALMYGVLYVVPYFFEDVMGRTPAQAGLLTTPLPVGMMLLAPIAGRISDRFGSRGPTTVGMIVSTVASAGLVLISLQVSYVYLIAVLLLIGVGMGVFTPPNNSSVMGASPRNRLGVSSGILNMSRSLGQSFGIAYAFTILEGIMLTMGYGTFQAPHTDLIVAFRWSFGAVALLGVFAALISALRGNVTKSETSAEAHVIEI